MLLNHRGRPLLINHDTSIDRSVYQTSIVMIDTDSYVLYHMNHNDPINRDVFRVLFTHRNHLLAFHHIFTFTFKLIFSVLCHLYWSLVLFTYILLVEVGVCVLFQEFI